MTGASLSAVGKTSPGSLVRKAMQAVTEHIRSEKLRVGDTLPAEGQFAERLGVSKAVMREAFGALAALQRIDVGNGRKARVAPLDGSVMAASLDHAVATAQVTVAEVWDVRRTLELRTVELAATHRTGGEAARLVRLTDEMTRNVDDLEAMTGCDIAFHRVLAEAGRNALFIQVIASFAPLMEVAVPAAWRTRGDPAQRRVMLDRHRAIAVAVADADPPMAVAAMKAHFDHSIGDILKSMGER